MSHLWKYSNNSKVAVSTHLLTLDFQFPNLQMRNLRT